MGNQEKEKILKLIEQFKFLDEVILNYQKQHKLIENTLLDYFKENDLDELEGISIFTYNYEPKLKLKDLKKHFNNEDSVLLDELVVYVDRIDSIDSLKYIEGLSEPIIKATENKLNNLPREKFERLRVKGVIK